MRARVINQNNLARRSSQIIYGLGQRERILGRGLEFGREVGEGEGVVLWAVEYLLASGDEDKRELG